LSAGIDGLLRRTTGSSVHAGVSDQGFLARDWLALMPLVAQLNPANLIKIQPGTSLPAFLVLVFFPWPQKHWQSVTFQAWLPCFYCWFPSW
jgi:hypothetical protein